MSFSIELERLFHLVRTKTLIASLFLGRSMSHGNIIMDYTQELTSEDAIVDALY